LLGVEFINEWFSNLLAAVLPVVKAALGLNYVQVSLLLSLLEVMDVISDAIFGFLGDIWSRRILITSGTLVAGLGLLLMGTAPGYLLLLLGVILHGFAGGPFVGLSQASLIDTRPGQHERMMAWWFIAGDIGKLMTPLMVTVAFAFGINWRPLFLAGGALFILYAFFLARAPFPRQKQSQAEAVTGQDEESKNTAIEAIEDEETINLRASLAALKTAALDPALLRWALILALLEMPVAGFVVLYFHDVAGLNEALASSTLLIVTLGALAGRLLLPWLLRHIAGMRLLRLAIWLGIISFALFLLAPPVLVKCVLLALFSLVEATWYPLAQAQAYATQPGKSGVVLSVTSLISPITTFLPLLVGAIAQAAGLSWASPSCCSGLPSSA
jgi:MFS family permease